MDICNFKFDMGLKKVSNVLRMLKTIFSYLSCLELEISNKLLKLFRHNLTIWFLDNRVKRLI